jgi:hypothetical protein
MPAVDPQSEAPSSTGNQLTSGQTTFAAQLSKDTGLDPTVIAAWLLAEESGSAATSRQAAGNNDWLNIGYTDSATIGAGDSIWSNPASAATATAAWLKGTNGAIPGYGNASAGVQSILRSAGSPATAQIAALQHSGWASSGYPALQADYQSIAQGTRNAITDAGATIPVSGAPSTGIIGALGGDIAAGPVAAAGAVSGVVSGVSGVASDVSSVSGLITDLTGKHGLITNLTSARFWLRVAGVIGALALFMFGLIELAGGHPVSAVGNAAKTAGPMMVA